MEDKLFYVAQKAFIEKDGKVLVLVKKNGKVDFPGGKMQEGETDHYGSLAREVREETGLQCNIKNPFYTWAFNLPESHKNAGRTVFVVGYMCEYSGGDIQISDEHVNHEWVDTTNFSKFDDGGSFFGALKEYFDCRNR